LKLAATLKVGLYEFHEPFVLAVCWHDAATSKYAFDRGGRGDGNPSLLATTTEAV